MYLPVGTPMNDFYGGKRPGDNLFADFARLRRRRRPESASGTTSSCITRSGTTTRRRAPNLSTSPWMAGRSKPSLRSRSKDSSSSSIASPESRSGRSKSVQSRSPLCRASARRRRNRFPTKPPPFERFGVSEDDVLDFTPELKAEALAILRKFDSGPPYTPPTERGTIVKPGTAAAPTGGARRSTPTRAISTFQLGRVLDGRHAEAASGAGLRRLRSRDESAKRVGCCVKGPRGLPLFKPPYSSITAYDMNRGEKLWAIPHGDGPRDHPASSGPQPAAARLVGKARRTAAHQDAALHRPGSGVLEVPRVRQAARVRRSGSSTCRGNRLRRRSPTCWTASSTSWSPLAAAINRMGSSRSRCDSCLAR